MKGKKVKASAGLTRYEAIPNDANAAGTVHGGTMMYLIDSVAGVTAKMHCGEYADNVVTAVIDKVDFLAPANIGDLLIIKTSVNYTGQTSMEVGTKIEVKYLKTGELKHVCTAYATFVALDQNRRPTPVPPIIPVTKTEKRRYREAEQRMYRRKQERAQKPKTKKRRK